MKVNTAPIVLFVYNRPEHTKTTIETLAKNDLAIDSDLFVFSDGPKDSDAVIKVDEVRKILKDSDGFKQIEIVEREVNLGLAANVIDGVSRIVKEYGRVIVLEDDIITAPYFLRYMNMSLDYYQNEKKIWHISGWNYPIDSSGLGDVFLWRVMNCWGWATWSDRWADFERNPASLIRSWSHKMIYKFNLEGANNFWCQVTANQEEKLNTWAVFWYATIFEKNGLCLHPSISLVFNSGHDGSGENCSDNHTFDTNLSTRNNWVFETNLVESRVATNRIKSFYKKTHKPLVQRVFNRILNACKKCKL